MIGLTAKQAQLLSFLRQEASEGICPSYEEMKDKLELRSKSGVFRLIRSLEERGHVRRLPNRARAIEVIGAFPSSLSEVSNAELLAELGRRVRFGQIAA